MGNAVFVGPAGSGKTTLLLGRYRDALRPFGPRWSLWLAPTRRSVESVRHRLLDGRFRACLRPSLMTFSQFARQILHRWLQPVRPLDPQMKRHLLRRLIGAHLDAGLLRHFARIARTGGFLDLLSGWTSDMKRREIWPDEFGRACSARGITQRDIELLGLYHDYQDHLARHNLFDAEGCFWSARTMLQEEGARLLAGLQLVVVDGFSDFTRTQHEILEVLARHAAELCVTLPLEPEPCRRELFHKSLETLEQLRRRLPGLEVREVPRAPRPAWPAMERLEGALFGDPRRARPAADTAGLEILATARQAGQIEHVGRRIKRLLVEGDAGQPVRPDDVALVFRNPNDAAAAVREVFNRLGIPYTMEAGHLLATAPVLRRLVALLSLDAEDWPWRRLIWLLSSACFRPRWPEWDEGRAVIAVDRTLRRLRVPRGRTELVQALQRQEKRLAERLEATAAGEPARLKLSQRLDETRRTSSVLAQLARAFDAMPHQATATEWVRAWHRLAGTLGLLDELHGDAAAGGDRHIFRAETARKMSQSPDNPPLVVPAALAWDRLAESMAAADRLARCLEQEPPQVDRAAALELLADTLHSVSVDVDADEPGRVRVLSARSVRTLSFPYVFLAGLSETSFPAPGREDRFYGDGESQRLIDAGLPLPTRDERSGEEMLLFYEAVTRATRRLWLCYPAMDDAGQPLLPSPYLDEVELACGDHAIRRIERMDLSPLPAADELLDVATFRRRAVADVLVGDVSSLAGLARHEPDSPATANLLAGLAGIQQRAQRDRFGAMEGMFHHEAAVNALQGALAPDRVYSVSQLEDYAACPFRFFLEHVLDVEPLEELELRPDYLARGQRAHQILAALHRRLNETHGKPTSPAEIDEGEYERLWRSLLAETAGNASLSPLDSALDEIDRRVLSQWLADYRRQHAEYDAQAGAGGPQVRPAYFEVSFGGPPDADNPLSTARPLELRHGDRTVRVSGRIDRIDVAACGRQSVHSVIDYKTGGAVALGVESALAGLTLQLPLYAMAAGALLLADRASLAWRAGYWYLAGDGFATRRALACHAQEAGRLVPTEAWQTLCRQLAATVVRLVEGITRGEFPVYNADPDCTGACPLRTVCRINQVRALEKTWAPPNAAN